MRTTTRWAWPVLAVLGAATAFAQTPVTAPPFAYLIDYAADHVGNEAYLAWLKQVAPDLLHLGKDVPMSHNWGPIAGWGGENQYTGGAGREAYLRRLSPDEVQARLESIRDFTARAHAAGVDKIMPYVCGMTIGGDPERRLGFWDFYDHWDDYAARFKLGPKPADPSTWLQRLPDGKPLFIYQRDTSSYAPSFRWATCMNNPGWRQWMAAVVRLAAEAGHDGVFPDNSYCRCYCEHCRAAFARFAAARGRPQATMVTETEGGYDWYLTQEFWIDSIARWLEDMRAEGRKVRPGFGIFPNFGTLPGYQRLATACDYQMGEGAFFGFSRGGFGQIWFHPGPGEERRRIVEDIFVTRLLDNIFELRYTAAAGGRPGYVVLTRGSAGDAAISLSWAETAAFGSGAALYGRRDASTELYQRWRAFLKRHRALYVGLKAHVRVGLAFWPKQAFHENFAHVAAVRDLAKALDAAHFVHRMVTEEEVEAGAFADVELLLVPRLDYLSAAAAGQLREFAAKGKLFWSGPPARHAHDHTELPADQRLDAVATQVGEKPSEVAEAVVRALGESVRITPGLTDDQLPGLRCEVRRDDAGRRLVVHALNYRVTPNANRGAVIPAPEVPLRVPLPAGWTVRAATVCGPDAIEPQPVEVLCRDGAAWLTLRDLITYQVVELRCDR